MVPVVESTKHCKMFAGVSSLMPALHVFDRDIKHKWQCDMITVVVSRGLLLCGNISPAIMLYVGSQQGCLTATCYTLVSGQHHCWSPLGHAHGECKLLYWFLSKHCKWSEIAI